MTNARAQSDQEEDGRMGWAVETVRGEAGILIGKRRAYENMRSESRPREKKNTMRLHTGLLFATEMPSVKRRMQSELRNYQLEKKEEDGVFIEMKGEDVLDLKGYINGVKGTPYEGGIFELDIKIGEDYPYRAPMIKFVTKIWHPSVNPFNGSVCLNARNDAWPVPMTIYKTLLTIQSWMSTIDAKEPIDVEILEQAIKNTAVFEKTANYWAWKFAGGRRPSNWDYESKVQVLNRLTRDENLAIIALSYHNWVLPNGVGPRTP
ncbi:unnamed protein product [Caenorhabditis sp. 36 PRJEB53466]|nr:unnamed protein product [Caenorhabditis sp. 36 PRJEB53466]